MAYLTDENGLITVRNKEVRIRPLDRERIASGKTKWQLINLVLPLLMIVLYGIVRAWNRRRKFART
jgi:hypothetical protein